MRKFELKRLALGRKLGFDRRLQKLIMEKPSKKRNEALMEALLSK